VGWSGWIGWKLGERDRGGTDRGDLDLSATYSDFYAFWKDVGSDNAILKQAEAEYAMLK